jgi:adenosylmethionine-8-amino-7-oxononanoate aminotransferase
VRGAYVLDKDKLQSIMETCRKYDILTIADEISTGVGRTGELFACKQFNVSPDIICIGKPLTNGMFPLAAALINEKVNHCDDSDSPQ